jgi:magnesium-transporting ATPase (P-type)
MDMGHDSSASNITNLPLSDPACNSDSCLAFKEAHQASQAQVSWASQFLYGHYTTWYYLVAISLAMLVYIFHTLENQRAFSRPSTGKTAISSKAIALVRWISYRRNHGRFADTVSLPAMGMLIFTLFTWLYLLLLTFIQRPYYRGHRGYGSPPLAVRTGLMATALTPIIVALAGKVNFVTILTGISHEKLNALHR